MLYNNPVKLLERVSQTRVADFSLALTIY